jgi:hypothetical protein
MPKCGRGGEGAFWCMTLAEVHNAMVSSVYVFDMNGMELYISNEDLKK